MVTGKYNADACDTVCEELDRGILRWQIREQSEPISFRRFITLLIDDSGFRQNFNKLLANTRFDSFRFETPALSYRSFDKPFEFVLINAPGLAARPADPLTFAEYFSDDGTTKNVTETQQWVVECSSLGGDATLIVPSPIAPHESYNHLGRFTRSAPVRQIDVLWQTVGQVLQRDVGDAPIWLNAEGSGVAWLHVRIDSRPKYYGHIAYTQQS